MAEPPRVFACVHESGGAAAEARVALQRAGMLLPFTHRTDQFMICIARGQIYP